jgi:hypothetical protein
MIGRPNEAPTPMLAKLWRRSWIRTPLRLAVRLIAAQGFLRSARGAPRLPPQR